MDSSPRATGPESDGPLDVLVIGGGQAGLVMGYHLSTRGQRFQILDAAPEVGHTWRLRWESLRLFTAAQYDNLPGMAFPAPRDTYPSKDDVADFLCAYAGKFQLPVVLDTKVTSLRRDEFYEAQTDKGPIRARNVVIATGPFQSPFIPAIAKNLDSDVFQIHSIDYHRPDDIPSGSVLVVGAANSGCQIALELSATHEVEIAVGKRLPTIPQRPFGRDVWWWATLLGITRIPFGSRLGKRLSTRDQVIGGGLRELQRNGATVRPGVTAAEGRSVTFADGSSSQYDAVVWATGFRPDYSWVEIPEVKNAQAGIRHDRGVTPAPGLYMLGLTWQHTRTSALLGWVTKDAEFLAERIVSRSSFSENPTGGQLESIRGSKEEK
jgi:putative flavoprotein involved in K+ transport